MPDYNRSVIHTFSMPGDTTNTYAMIDANIYANVTAGLTPTQKAVIDAYRWTPTAAQLPNVPRWAGDDPKAVYFKTTTTKMRAALARYYR